MKKDGLILELDRVEVITRTFNRNNQCVKEEFEFYLPKESRPAQIGFTPKNKKNK